MKEILKKVRDEYNLEPATFSSLYRSIKRYSKHIGRILEEIESADPKTRIIFVELLIGWKSNSADKIDKLVNIISSHTAEQLKSDLFFFNKYGYYKLFQDGIEFHLDMLFFFPEDYEDFLCRTRQSKCAEGLLSAAKLNIYKEYTRALDACLYVNAEQLLLIFIQENFDKLLALSRSEHAEQCSLLFKWIGDHPGSWSQILVMDLKDLLEIASMHNSFKKNHPHIELPKLETLIQAWKKNSNSAGRLLTFFGSINQAPGRIFEDWANNFYIETVCDSFLLIPPETLFHKIEIARFVHVLNNTQEKLPEAELSKMLTKEKIGCLNTLCLWIQEGEAELAIAVCKMYLSKNETKSQIGLCAMKQDVETAKIILLYAVTDRAGTISLLPSGTGELSPHKKNILATKLFETVCGSKGEKPLRSWLLRNLDPVTASAMKDFSLGEIFYGTPLTVQQDTIHMCFLVKSSTERAHLFQIIATCPSQYFVDIILANPELKFIQRLLRYIPNPRNLPRIVNVFTHISNNTRVPSVPSARTFLASSTKTLAVLMKKKPELSAVINLVLADRSKLGKRIRIAIADWYRYKQADQLTAFFSHFPLKSRKNDAGAVIPEQHELWESVAARLECGRMGHIADVMTTLSLNTNSLVFKAIEACRAFENPKILKQLLFCDENDNETNRILSALVKDPADSWNLFLLSVKTMDKNTSCQAYLDASPESTYVLKNLVRVNRPHLATIYARNKNLNYTAYHLGLTRKEASKAKVSPIKHAWKNTTRLTKHAKTGKRTSLGAYDNFRDNDESIEQYKEVVLALSMTKGLIFDGLLPKERIDDVLAATPKTIVGSDHYEYLTNTLHLLQDSVDLCDRIVALGHQFPLSQTGILIINGLLERALDHPVALQEIKLTLLSALLCRPRQSLGVGSCFAAAEMIRLPSSSEGLLHLLELYKQILQTGAITLYNSETQKQEELHVTPRYLELDLGLSLSHPLLKALEYAVAAKGRNEEHSHVSMARDAIFNPGGYAASLLNNVYITHTSKHPGPLPFEKAQFLDDLKTTFNKTAVELFNPKIKINGKSFSGWELLLRDSLQPISNIDEYKHLYKQVITETLALYYKKHPFGTLGFSLTHEIEKVIKLYFEPEHSFSTFFVDYLLQNLSLQSKTDLWQREGGGNTEKILAGFHSLEKYPTFNFNVSSVKEAFHYLLKYCDDLPAGTKNAARKNKNFYLPLSIPSHSVNLLPNSLLSLLKKNGSSKQVLQAVQKDCAALYKKKITKNLAKEALKTLHDSLERKFDSQTNTKFAEALKLYKLEEMNLKQFAHVCLREISIACDDKLISLREMVYFIDQAIYESLDPNEEIPLVIFADANWSGLEHSDILLAFGWSFASNKLEVFVTTQNLSEINLLSWDVDNEKGWTLYAPPLL